MQASHLIKIFENSETKTKLISLELCTKREINISRVMALAPAFCSVTWLTNKVRNFQEHPTILLSRQLIEHGTNVLIHLPGRIYRQQEVFDILTIIKSIGVRNILAVQGERSLGASKQDFPYASYLVKYIKQNFGEYFCVGVTGYPSGHPTSQSLKEDLQYLKQKVESGADFIITQAVFDKDTLSDFYKNCNELEINVPIIPGLFIINSYSSLMNMVKFCKLNLTDNINKFINENKDDSQLMEEYGISSIANIIEYIFSDENVNSHCAHIFTLNDLDMVEKLFHKLKYVK